VSDVAEEHRQPPLTAVKEHTLKVRANELTWLRIVKNGSQPMEILLRPGETLEETASERMLVVVGNAGGVNVTFDGKTFDTLGKRGEVVSLSLP
jgi:5-deoxy-D-glucuronate isomerase